MLSRTSKVLVIAAVAIGGALYLYLRLGGESATDTAPTDAYPPGRWRRAPVGTAVAGEDLGRLMSLPYLQGKVEAGASAGVISHQPDLAFEGLNLYSSGHAAEAILMDMRGEVVHRWRMPFAEAFPDAAGDAGSLYFRRVALLEDGDLLALFQGWGLVRLDRRSNLVWALPLPVFNDLYVMRNGHILVLHKKAILDPEVDTAEAMLEDFVVELSQDGQEIERWSLLELFRSSEYAQLLDSMGTSGDVLHSNTVTLLESSPFDDGIFQPHRLLVSLREVDVVGVVDPATGQVVWAARGSWRRQHEPVLTEAGGVLLFDNLGGPDGRARVLELDPQTDEVTWSWGDAEDQTLFSPEGGTVSRLPNGNSLITASESGRAVEVTPAGEIVWEFLSPHRAGPNDELVAALWEVERLEPEAASWLVSDDE